MVHLSSQQKDEAITAAPPFTGGTPTPPGLKVWADHLCSSSSVHQVSSVHLHSQITWPSESPDHLLSLFWGFFNLSFPSMWSSSGSDQNEFIIMSLLISVFYVSVCVCGPGASVCLDTDDIMWSLFCDWLMFVYELADIQRESQSSCWWW